jgi:5-methylcytosine-specific restriction protein A
MPNKSAWTRDELILALDLYFRLAPRTPDPKMSEVKDLVDLLRRPSLRVPGVAARSPASVVMKLMNFRSVDPGYRGKGLTAGGRLDREIWEEFGGNPKRLSKVAIAIQKGAVEESGVIQSDLDPSVVEAEEGAILTRLHLVRERNSRLVDQKKSSVLASSGKLACEVCGFDFSEAFGPVGNGIIDCHHKVALSELPSGRTTKLDDLAVLCSNCHRMIHARRPWLTIEQLRVLVTEQDIV